VRTIVYIDGFDLYYRALRGTPHKWLAPRMLATQLLRPTDSIVAINYYTANVSGKADPGQPRRQNAYLRAIESIPELKIYRGRFLAREVCRPLVGKIPLVHPTCDGPQYVMVADSEE
jgi:hypothetical protein